MIGYIFYKLTDFRILKNIKGKKYIGRLNIGRLNIGRTRGTYRNKKQISTRLHNKQMSIKILKHS